LVHAARFDVRAAIQTFQPGVLFAQFSDGLLQAGYLTKRFGPQQFKLCAVQRGNGGRRRRMMQRVDTAESTQAKNDGFPTFLPLLHSARSKMAPQGGEDGLVYPVIDFVVDFTGVRLKCE
jgi:hypothetical protein